MDPVVVRVNTAAATHGFYMGRREQLIADELKRGGIPAVAGHGGITVPTGTLEVTEEEGLRVFTWTPPDKVVHVPVPAGDNNPEVKALREQTEEAEEAETETPAPTTRKKRS